MEHVTAIPRGKDFERCFKIVEETMKVDGQHLTDKELELLTKDVMDTSVMIGGDYSNDCIREILLDYIQSGFYPRFKKLHAAELRGE